MGGGQYDALEDGKGGDAFAGYGAMGNAEELDRHRKRAYGGGTVLAGTKAPFLVTYRRSLNALAILLSLFIPWLVGLVACWILSSKVRYYQPYIAWGIFAADVLVVVYFFVRALEALWEKTRRGLYVPSWYIFVFLTSLLLLLFGYWMGDHVYQTTVKDSLMMSELTSYSDIDASRMSGAQMMDVGTIYFTNDTKLDLSRTMGFKDRKMYCVAPIVSGTALPASFDFWVVGENCCSPPPAPGASRSYHCGAFNQPNTTCATRLMNDDARPFYRMAVQQSEARYSINAIHPLFFTWGCSGNGAGGSGSGGGAGGAGGSGGDGSAGGSDSGKKSGMSTGKVLFQTAAFGSFFLQLFLVIFATLAFSTLGQPV